MKTMPNWTIALVLSFVMLLGVAHAQTQQYAPQGLPVTDPSVFSQTIALQVSRDRMTPIRDAMRQMLGVEQLNTDLEVSVVQMERWLGDSPSEEVTKLEDISLARTLRRIYYLNTFRGKLLFTRYDFARTPGGWMLSGITFGSTWNSVNANPVTPGWTVTQ